MTYVSPAIIATPVVEGNDSSKPEQNFREQLSISGLRARTNRSVPSALSEVSYTTRADIFLNKFH